MLLLSLLRMLSFRRFVRPQSTMATAQVLFHRFFYVSSMRSFSINVRPLSSTSCDTFNTCMSSPYCQDTAIASLYLSTKLCETPIRLKTLLATYLISLRWRQHLRRALRAEDPQMRDLEEAAERVPTIEVPPAHASVWWSIKEAVCVGEMQILKRLGFNMQVRNPQPPPLFTDVLNRFSHPSGGPAV